MLALPLPTFLLRVRGESFTTEGPHCRSHDMGPAPSSHPVGAHPHFSEAHSQADCPGAAFSVEDSSSLPSGHDGLMDKVQALKAWEQLPLSDDFDEWSDSCHRRGFSVLTSFNVTSFLSHESFLTDLRSSLLVVQEVGCQLRLSSRLTQASWSVNLGPPAKAKEFSNRNSDTAACGGLLVAARPGGVTNIAQELPVGMTSPRSQVCRWVLSGHTVYVVNLYGFAGGSHADRANTAALLDHAWNFVSTLGLVPIVIAGDLNCNIFESSIFRSASHAGWKVANAFGHDAILPTCKTHNGGDHTIDWVLVNPVALVWKGQCPTHAAVSIAFSWQCLSEPIWVLKIGCFK